jgi:predicted DNA-binding transcriptional regulator AlpA
MENLLNKKQVSELLNISVKTLDLWGAQQKGPKPLKLGRLVRFTKSEVITFIQKLSEGK